MRLASRVKRLEAKTGSCPVCGGAGVLAIVLDQEPAPPGCPRCGRQHLLRAVGITEEQWRAEKRTLQAGR